jgi:hypothetical protein
MPLHIREEVVDDWDFNFNLLQEYGDEHGTHNVPQKELFKGNSLGQWVSKQRQNYSKNVLREQRKDQLQVLVDAGTFAWKCLTTR